MDIIKCKKAEVGYVFEESLRWYCNRVKELEGVSSEWLAERRNRAEDFTSGSTRVYGFEPWGWVVDDVMKNSGSTPTEFRKACLLKLQSPFPKIVEGTSVLFYTELEFALEWHKEPRKHYAVVGMTEHRPDMEPRTIDAMHRVWQMIGDDFLVGDDGKPDYKMVVKATLVREVVCDADRLKMYGDDDEASKWFYSLPRKEQQKIEKKAFPPGRNYGW